MIDGTTQRGEGIDDAIGQFFPGLEMQVADLRNKKRMIRNKASENTNITMPG